MGWTLEQIDELHEIGEEWEKVFEEPLNGLAMFGPGHFPLFRKCLRLKSQQPIKDYIEANADKDF